MVRSAPPEKASLPEATTQPLMPASAATASTMRDSSSMASRVMTFIERSGMSQVAVAMPSPSVSKRKFVRSIVCSQASPLSRMGGVGGEGEPGGLRRERRSAFVQGAPSPLPLSHPGEGSNPFDDRRGAHAGADAERHERGFLAGALELVEHGAEDHGAGRAERMAHGDR